MSHLLACSLLTVAGVLPPNVSAVCDSTDSTEWHGMAMPSLRFPTAFAPKSNEDRAKSTSFRTFVIGVQRMDRDTAVLRQARPSWLGLHSPKLVLFEASPHSLRCRLLIQKTPDIQGFYNPNW